MQQSPPMRRSGHHAGRIRELFQRSNSRPQRDSLVCQALDELALLLEALQATEEELTLARERQLDGYALLQAEHQTYLDLFSHAPFAYLSTRLDGTIRRANRAAQELLQQPDNLVGQALSRYLPADQERTFTRMLQRLSAEAGVEKLTIMRHRAPGDQEALTLEGHTACNSTGRAQELRWIVYPAPVAALEPAPPVDGSLTQERIRLLTEALLLVQATPTWTAAGLQLASLATATSGVDIIVMERISAAERESIISIRGGADTGGGRLLRQCQPASEQKAASPAGALALTDNAALQCCGLPTEAAAWGAPLLPLHGYCAEATTMSQQVRIVWLQNVAHPDYTLDQRALLDLIAAKMVERG